MSTELEVAMFPIQNPGSHISNKVKEGCVIQIEWTKSKSTSILGACVVTVKIYITVFTVFKKDLILTTSKHFYVQVLASETMFMFE